MPETVELLVRNVRRYDDNRKVDVAIDNGLIRRISESAGAVEPAEVLDLDGYVVSPGFVEPHFHLDKCLAAEIALPDGTLGEQLEAFCEAKSRLSAETVAERACRMGSILASRGVVHVRSFADIDQFAELRILEGLKEAKRRLEGLIDVQIVAFPRWASSRTISAQPLNGCSVASGVLNCPFAGLPPSLSHPAVTTIPPASAPAITWR